MKDELEKKMSTSTSERLRDGNNQRKEMGTSTSERVRDANNQRKEMKMK